MRTLILLIFAFASHASGQNPDTKAFEGCWDNVEDDRRPGSHPGLCFGPEDVIVNFWTSIGDLDYSEVQWALGPNSTIQIADTLCRYRFEETTLNISECYFKGTFKKYGSNESQRR